MSRIKNYLLWSTCVLLFFGWSCNTTSKKVIVLEPDSSEIIAEYKGPENMGWAITHNIMYPKSEMQMNRTGIVEVLFTVNEEGDVENVKASIRTNEESSELAVARKLIEGKEILGLNLPVLQSVINSVEMLQFEPAKKHGRTISSEFSTSVEFMLIP